MNENENLMDKVISLCKRRGFIFPGSEIYGGLANSWDYGPLGHQLKQNIKTLWWKFFVTGREDMVPMDTAIIMNPRVWEASGHLQNFSDALVECKVCHKRFRADHLLEAKGITPRYAKEELQDLDQINCPECAGDLTAPKNFNLMFKTAFGINDATALDVYLRPETAGGMFVNFKNILNVTRKRLPFGIAQVGKCFRNEITPGNFIFRTREFDLMEFEYFIRPEEWEKWFEYWLGEMKLWLKDLGVREDKLVYHEIEDGERAHYSKRTIDVEYQYPFGQQELYGLAYRGDFDLGNHERVSGKNIKYKDPETKEVRIYYLILELFANGNVILVDKDYTILNSLEKKKFKDN